MRVIIALVAEPFGAAGVLVQMVTPRSINWASSCSTNFSTTCRIVSLSSARKGDHRIQTVAEFRREDAFDGGGIFTLALVAAKADRRFGHFERAGVDGHDQTTLRKSTARPLWSVSLPWSITCKRMLNSPGAPFRSRQAAARNAGADRRRRSASRPDRSRHSREARRSGAKPHASPYIRTCQSAASRRRGIGASCLATSVLPTPVGPANR